MLALAATALATASAGLPVVKGEDGLAQELKAHGRPAVVHFWASWCGPCVEELPEIRRLAKALEGFRVDLALVSLDDPAQAPQAERLLQSQGLAGLPNAWAVILDAPDPTPVAAKFDSHWSGGLPATFFRLESGVVVSSHLGPTPVDAIVNEVRRRLKPKSQELP